MSETGDLVTRRYGSFRGADFRGEDDNLARSPDCLNVWRDYRETGGIRTRPGMKRHVYRNQGAHGMHFHGNNIYVHMDQWLFQFETSINGIIGEYTLSKMCAVKRSHFFVHGENLYFCDSKNYWIVGDKKITEVTDVAYVPITSDGGTAGTQDTPGSRRKFQDINMLSDYRINTFCLEEVTEMEGKTYIWLDADNIDTDFVPEVLIDGHDLDWYAYTTVSIDYGKGRILIEGPIPAPSTDGQDNVSVKFKKHVDGCAEKILNCTLVQAFDNRIFFSGNPNYPNMVWYCAKEDPTYWMDTDYLEEGIDDARVTGMVAGNNALWVFREASPMNTTIFYHTPSTDAEFGKVYPFQHSSISTGCIGGAVNFNDDIVFFSNRGMEGISGDITTEQVIGHRSSLVDSKMISDSEYKNLVTVEWEGYLLVCVGNKIFLADSRKMFSNEGRAEYEWFYWELDLPLKANIRCATVYEGNLYICTGKGVYEISANRTEDGEYVNTTDNGAAIESYWVTPKDRFKAPQKLKTTNKRGCVVEATGDVEVYAKTENTDFELIGSYENIKDYFVSRIKRKKWKDIQLKFYSKTGFSLESATLEAFIGGYIKR